MIYPMKLQAPLKDYLWGGTILKERYGKESDLEKVAESWELSCHADGNSVIENGIYANQTLSNYLEEVGFEVLGKNQQEFKNKLVFPILIKLIDANDNLSIQVHPEDAYALEMEKEYGKTEMWYVMEAEENATLIYGLKETITKEIFQEKIADGSLLEVCNIVPVKKGDVFFIPAGTLHGIGKGIVIAEVQQNSNTTYRVFDYNRKGADGKTRELHIEKAVAVTNLEVQCMGEKKESLIEEEKDYRKELLCTCDYFTTSILNLHGRYEGNVKDSSFYSLVCLDTHTEISLTSKHGDIIMKKGETIFLQADYGTFILEGEGEILIAHI